MKPRDIIIKTCKYLDIQLPDCCSSDTMTSQLSSQLQYNTVLSNMLMCLDNVLAELNSYLPNIVVQKVQVSQGLLSKDSLSQSIVEVIRLRDMQSHNVPYRYIAEGLLVEEDGSMEIIYSTNYPPCQYLEDITVPCAKIDTRVLSLALCSEYSLLCGDYDDFAMWDSRYKQCLPAIVAKKTSVNMPARGWC